MTLKEPVFQDVLDARRVIQPHIYRTPLRRYPALSDLIGAEVWVKHENFQVAGSFKVRGGLNLVARTTRGGAGQGVHFGLNGQSWAVGSLCRRGVRVEGDHCRSKGSEPHQGVRNASTWRTRPSPRTCF